MNPKFKVGDKVVVVDANPGDIRNYIQNGEEYVVCDAYESCGVSDGGIIYLEGIDAGYFGKRFELAKPTFEKVTPNGMRVGDKVVCVDQGGNCIEVGLTYKISAIYDSSLMGENGMVSVDGKEGRIFYNRFELYKEPAVEPGNFEVTEDKPVDDKKLMHITYSGVTITLDPSMRAGSRMLLDVLLDVIYGHAKGGV